MIKLHVTKVNMNLACTPDMKETNVRNDQMNLYNMQVPWACNLVLTRANG